MTTTTICKTLIVVIATLVFVLNGAHSFQSICVQLSSSQAIRSTALLGKKSSSSKNTRRDQQEGEEILFGGEAGLDFGQELPTDDQISNSLNRKLKELEYGIGKRYIIRTQRGFLNVHHEVRTERSTHIEKRNILMNSVTPI